MSFINAFTNVEAMPKVNINYKARLIVLLDLEGIDDKGVVLDI